MQVCAPPRKYWGISHRIGEAGGAACEVAPSRRIFTESRGVICGKLSVINAKSDLEPWRGQCLVFIYLDIYRGISPKSLVSPPPQKKNLRIRQKSATCAAKSFQL